MTILWMWKRINFISFSQLCNIYYIFYVCINALKNIFHLKKGYIFYLKRAFHLNNFVFKE